MKTNNIIEVIERRKSVRSYSGEALCEEYADAIVRFISGLKAPFGAKVRIELIRTSSGNKPVKLGTYGYISGALDYLVLIYEKGLLAEESAAYLFEQVILFCTGMGLGTCWLGGVFNRKDFCSQVELNSSEKLAIVSPLGYEMAKKRLIESIIGAKNKHQSRKPFGTLFFLQHFDTPLSEEAAGVYRKPLEMVRLAPSANNQQSWRVVLCGDVLHFYYHTPSVGFTSIDLGIALCHFEQTCKELHIQGKYEVFKEKNAIPAGKGNNYVISWIG
jgi:nitroreductase